MRRNTIALAVLMSAWLYAGLAGIDFGHHWDEERITASVAASLRSGVMLPGWYNYPSFCYHLGLLTAAPVALEAMLASPSTAEMAEAVATMADEVERRPYLLRLRVFFLLLSSLSALWWYLLVLRWRGGTEALIAAGLLLASWEFGYHARWVAPDALLAMSVALAMPAMFPLVAAFRRRRFLFVAAIAGLATGIKYQGGILLLPLLLVYLRRETDESGNKRGWMLLQSAAVFACAFLATTPGAAVDPFRFVGDVVVELRHYSAGHWGHSITAGPEHAIAMLRWLVLDEPSPWAVVSLAVSIFAVFGAISLFREDRRLAAWYLFLPLAYLIYMAFQEVMIVRNLLLLLPFLSVLAARGFTASAAIPRPPLLRNAIRALPVLIVVASLAWQIDAGEEIRSRRERDVLVETREWLGRNTHRSVMLSPPLAERLGTGASGTSLSGNGDTIFIFSTAEIDSLMLLPANRDMYVPVSVLPDASVTAYPDWAGEEKVLGISLTVARQHPVFMPLLEP